MKQHITEDQFNELTNDQKNEWYKFCRMNKHVVFDYGGDNFEVLHFPSIGEMIHFLIIYHWFPAEYKLTINICDELWEIVRDLINGNIKMQA